MAETTSKTTICMDCGEEFDGGPRIKRCDPCRVKGRERMRAWRAAQPKTELPDPICEDCGQPFERTAPKGRVTKKYCDACLVIRARANTNAHKRRKRAEAKAAREPRTCLDCPADLTGEYGKILRCDPCRKALARNRTREWKEAHPKPAVVFYCIVCNEAIKRVGNSGRPIYCHEHAAAAKRASSRRTDKRRATVRRPNSGRGVWYTHCHYCGSELPEPRQSFRSPARCEPCKRQRHYQYMRDRTTTRMAAARCQDCGQAVNPKRKGPRNRCADCRLAHKRAKVRQYAHERRALMNGVESEYFSSVEIYERDGWRCGLCRRKIRRDLQHPHPMSASLDHVIPLVHGGPHTRANVQAAHLRCNMIKKDKIENVQMALFG